MTAKRPSKKGRAMPGLRLPAAPKATRPAWSLSERDREAALWQADRSLASVESAGTLHEEDRELLRESLAAAIAFHGLSMLIDTLEFDEQSDEIAAELKEVRIGFALGLKALNSALGERALSMDATKKAAEKRWEADPRTHARAQIILELERWQAGLVAYDGVPQFALKMHARHADAYKSERSIERIAREWFGNHTAAL